MAGLEESDRAGFSAETVQAQTRACKASVPDSCTNLLHQVQNFYALFVVVFGKDFRIAATFVSSLKKLKRMKMFCYNKVSRFDNQTM
mmetsp:Transcript_9425/g.13998  ORF Transcript_9425/g.13998 Transcript_9425/m.13998 type:complete len:87 (-) Transcript_9425:58-318(-)